MKNSSGSLSKYGSIVRMSIHSLVRWKKLVVLTILLATFALFAWKMTIRKQDGLTVWPAQAHDSFGGGGLDVITPDKFFTSLDVPLGKEGNVWNSRVVN